MSTVVAVAAHHDFKVADRTTTCARPVSYCRQDYIITTHTRNITLNLCRSVTTEPWNIGDEDPKKVGAFTRAAHGDISMGYVPTTSLTLEMNIHNLKENIILRFTSETVIQSCCCWMALNALSPSQ